MCVFVGGRRLAINSREVYFNTVNIGILQYCKVCVFVGGWRLAISSMEVYFNAVTSSDTQSDSFKEMVILTGHCQSYACKVCTHKIHIVLSYFYVYV